jgi:hypothetical protein
VLHLGLWVVGYQEAYSVNAQNGETGEEISWFVEELTGLQDFQD